MRRPLGFTLVEVMVALGIFSIVSMALLVFFLFSTRSFAALANYAILDQYNRQAMDRFTSELREAQQVTDYTSNATMTSITFLSGVDPGAYNTNTHSFVGGSGGGLVTYTFDSSNQQVRRTDTNGTQVLLTNCNMLAFQLDMRPSPYVTNGSWDYYPVQATNNWQQNVKVVRLTWKTSMMINPTPRITSEDIQTASVVIRKQQDN